MSPRCWPKRLLDLALKLGSRRCRPVEPEEEADETLEGLMHAEPVDHVAAEHAVPVGAGSAEGRLT
jgi:hypothetical protein